MAVWSNVMVSRIALEERFDGEYFSPSYLEMDSVLSSISNIEPLGWLTNSVRKGIFDISPKRYRDKGVPLIRTFQIKSPLISKESLIYIDAHDHTKYFSKTELEPGDVVFTKIGAGIGDVAILPPDFERYNFSQNVAGASVNRQRIDGFYLLAFLSTKWGKKQLRRFMMPSGQGKLELRDIKKIRVVRLGEDETTIGKLVVQAEALERESVGKYALASQLLEAELGLDKLTFEKPMGYTARLSDLEISRRADAEFFHVSYEPFISVVKSYPLGWSPLGNLTSRVLPNFDARKRSGDFEYIEIGDVNVGNGAYTTTKINSKALPANAKIALSGGEILFSQVRPTRGAIAIANDELDHATVSSGAFYVCKANDVSYREAIWLYLRSIRNVFDKYCGGTSYPTIDSRYIAKFPVPHFAEDFALRLRELVSESKNAKRKSDELLEQAKGRVDQLIEEAVQA